MVKEEIILKQYTSNFVILPRSLISIFFNAVLTVLIGKKDKVTLRITKSPRNVQNAWNQPQAMIHSDISLSTEFWPWKAVEIWFIPRPLTFKGQIDS